MVMKHTDEKQLTAWLQSRHCEPYRKELATHIIQLAAQLPQQATFSLISWLQAGFTALLMPRPAYLMTILLACGVIIGSTVLTTNAEDEAYNMGLQASLYDDGGNL